MALEREAHGAYSELRRAIVGAALLERAYAYYFWRASLSFLLFAGGLGLPFILVPSAPALLISALAIAFGSIQVALIGHDAGHLAIFKSARANGALGALCWSLSLGISFWYWTDRHTRHHTSTNDAAADPDLQWAGLVAYAEEIVTARPNRSTWLTRYQAILGPLYTLFLPFAFRVEGWQFTLNRLRGSRRMAEICLMTLSTFAWLLPFAALSWWWLGVFFLSQSLAGLYLALAIAPNHKGMPVWPAGTQLSFLERQVLSSRNVTPSRLWDFVFGGLNYQVEHHLFPTMPRVHFGAARALVKPFCAAHGLAYTEMGALASYRLVIAELRRVAQSTATSGAA
ncbi:MAG: acyl-CoA desaturase [Chloroflexi bacterium]|nr:acyl-CoA desaturase [Chloroflexota bacterium]